METLTDTPSAMPIRKTNRVREHALLREREQNGVLRDVRAAWQSLLGRGPLQPDLIEPLLLLSNVRQFAPGQPVLSRREIARNLLLLVSGDVGLGLSTPGAPFRIERSLRGPAWLDLSSAWLECHPAMDGMTLGNAVIAHVSRSAYQSLMARQPELARRTVVCLAEQLHAATGVTQDLMHKDAQARLATWLLRRHASEGAAGRIALHERKRDIASQLAVTPETLSRLLKQFSDDALLEVHGYSIALLDIPGLRARAASDDAAAEEVALPGSQPTGAAGNAEGKAQAAST
jgi:Crp-like helix-turn-helix domain